jgi:hypothetical protein
MLTSFRASEMLELNFKPDKINEKSVKPKGQVQDVSEKYAAHMFSRTKREQIKQPETTKRSESHGVTVNKICSSQSQLR